MPLSFQSRGKPGNPLLFFIHGWPDTGALWKNQLDHFSRQYHCIAVTLPNFEGKMGDPWGYDFPELVDLITQTIQLGLAQGHEAKVILVGHDWGAYLAYLVERKHPELIQAMVTLDVGGHFKPSSIGHALFIVTYQGLLLLAFLLGHMAPRLGTAMTQWFSKFARAPRGGNVHHGMNYLYFYIWRGKLSKNYRSSILTRYRPTRPILFLYGVKKKYHFHSTYWLDLVTSTPKGRVEALAHSDHWLNIREPERTNALIDSWLEDLG
jgi:pimeloyl-ACP methyl ester carboxylesterase